MPEEFFDRLERNLSAGWDSDAAYTWAESSGRPRGEDEADSLAQPEQEFDYSKGVCCPRCKGEGCLMLPNKPKLTIIECGYCEGRGSVTKDKANPLMREL